MTPDQDLGSAHRRLPAEPRAAHPDVQCDHRTVVDVTALPGDWWAVSGEEAAALELQVAHEAPQGHRLQGVVIKPVAVKRHLKDVIYWLPSEQQWAWVHLTGQVETDPLWPSTLLASDWERLVAQLVD